MYLINTQDKTYHETSKLELKEMVGSQSKSEFESEFCSLLGVIQFDKVNKALPSGMQYVHSEETILTRYPNFENVTQFL